MSPVPATSELGKTCEAWRAKWPDALAVWSKFTRLREPRWCFTQKEEKEEGLTGSFAMIRFDDHAIVISIRQVVEGHLEKFAREVMAHEIGHHVYAPGDLTDHTRMLARMRRSLPTKEHLAGFIANLYTDLLINNRLQRGSGLDIAGVYQAIGSGSTDRMWTLYMRMYEILWSLQKGTLAKGKIDEVLEGDAQLGSRVIRVYARDWLRGSGRFAALCLPYLMEDEGKATRKILLPLLDTENAGDGGVPDGLTEIDEDEIEGAIHPSLDDELTGLSEDADGVADGDGDAGTKEGKGIGRNRAGSLKPQQRHRDPIDYRELLKSAGVKLSDHEIAIRYYRERAIPYLVPFPTRKMPESMDPLPEGLHAWDFGEPLENADWFESLIQSPTIIPGVTTVQRTYGTSQGFDAEKIPLDLFIGVDCSGSMVNPQINFSPPVLAGAIMALSALRAGANVMVTLSGEPGSHISTNGFLRDEKEILKVLTGYLGTGYTFGIPRLKEAFKDRKPSAPPAHILIVTDNDIFMMLEGGEYRKKGNGEGWIIAKEALEKARGGGTYLLHMPLSWENKNIARMANDGWDVYSVLNWDDIITFARTFSQKKYGDEADVKK